MAGSFQKLKSYWLQRHGWSWEQKWKSGAGRTELSREKIWLRPAWALFVLMGLVLAVILQIPAGLLLAVGWLWLLPFHILDGLAAGPCPRKEDRCADFPDRILRTSISLGSDADVPKARSLCGKGWLPA